MGRLYPNFWSKRPAREERKAVNEFRERIERIRTGNPFLPKSAGLEILQPKIFWPFPTATRRTIAGRGLDASPPVNSLYSAARLYSTARLFPNPLNPC